MAIGSGGTLARVRSGVPNITELFSIVKQLSFDELRDEALLPPRLLLLGADLSRLAELREQLGGADAASYIETATFKHLPSFLEAYDGIVLVNALPTDRDLPQITQLLTAEETAGRTLTLQTPPGNGTDGRDTASSETIANLRERLVTRLAHRQLALGRYLPAFRAPAAQAVISATARVNAEFALLSNLPAVIPLVGNLMAVGADFLVLTKNQLMMMYKLAAINGKDLQQPWRIYAELLPVVGAGILYRTAARELAGMIPFAAGTIPKVLIAYTGTVATGHTGNTYYLYGERLSNEQVKALYVRALATAKQLGLTERRRGQVIEGQYTERPDDGSDTVVAIKPHPLAEAERAQTTPAPEIQRGM
jgi:uncharacterized protein (DUF697 family)